MAAMLPEIKVAFQLWGQGAGHFNDGGTAAGQYEHAVLIRLIAFCAIFF